MQRRDFIKKSIAASALASTNALFSCTAAAEKLNILVLGGTYFVGPAIVSAALQNHHTVTLFNRGITNPSLFAELPLIKGDREQGIEAYASLKKQSWDIVIDVWPEKSKLVEEATRALKDHAQHYIYISSIAVYNNFQEVGLHEESDVVDCTIPKNEWGYAEEKLTAEGFVKDRFQRHTIIRPGPIKGWRDPAQDLLYWCIKLNRDDAILAPGSGMDPIQFIDVKDVGRFALTAAENNLLGIYNCTGPKEQLLWRNFLINAKQHFNSSTALVWADEEFLKSNEVRSFSDLPLWAPLSEDKGFMQISSKKMTDTGFAHAPVDATLDDCLNWYRSHPNPNLKFGTPLFEIGLDRDKELILIDKLKAKS